MKITKLGKNPKNKVVVQTDTNENVLGDDAVVKNKDKKFSRKKIKTKKSQKSSGKSSVKNKFHMPKKAVEKSGLTETEKKESKKGNKKINFSISNNVSIRAKLVAGFIVPIILILILGIVSYNSASKAITKNFTNSSESAIQKTGDYYSLLFSNVKAVANDFGTNADVQAYYSGSYSNDPIAENDIYSSISKSLLSTVSANKAVKSAFVVGKYGKIVNCGTFDTTVNPSDVYAKLAKSAEGQEIDKKMYGWFSQREYFDTVAKASYSVSYGKQLLGKSQKSVGYIFVDVDKDYMQAALTDVNLGEDSIVAVIAPDGGEIYATGIEKEQGYISNNDFYQEILSSEEKSGSRSVKINGVKSLFIYDIIDGGFMVCGIIPQSTINSQASTIRNVSIIMVIISCIVSFFIAFMITKNIDLSVRNIMKVLSRAATGDLTSHTTIKGNDEFAKLGNSTDEMIGNVKSLIQKTNDITEKVNDSVNLVTDNSKELLRGTKEITSSIQEIENGVVQQAEDSESCLRQMDSLAEKINEVSENSEKIAKIAEETTQTVDDGKKSIAKLKETSESTVMITRQVIEEINNLKDSSKAIDNIIGVINEIADQTNLLSLNASIEAARAGEAGRGFAVVADEIRKLADQSVASVNEIRKIVQDINDKTNSTVEIARKAEQVVEEQGKTYAGTEETFGNIQIQVQELVGNLNNITNGINIISEAKNQTVDSIQSISAVSQQTAAASEEVTETANRQLKQAEKLNLCASDLNSNTESLGEAIHLFKI